jgi:hypothetical protein
MSVFIHICIQGVTTLFCVITLYTRELVWINEYKKEQNTKF